MLDICISVIKKYNSKFVIEIRDIWPLSIYEDVPKLMWPFINISIKFLERRYYNKADSIIVTAPKADKYLLDNFNVDQDKIHYVPHGINIEEFDNNNKIFVRKLPDKFNITYIGSLSKSEGLENLLDLAKQLRNNKEININIFGDGTEKGKLENIIKSNNLINVKLYGAIDSKYVPNILSNSDILWCGLKEREVFKYGISKNKFLTI